MTLFIRASLEAERCLSHSVQGGHRMNLHANARSCPKSRALIAARVLDYGWSLAAAAEAAGVSVPTARKWVRRAAAGESLADRSSAPRRVPSRTPARVVAAIEALRRQRMTAAAIATALSLALSTVRSGLSGSGWGSARDSTRR